MVVGKEYVNAVMGKMDYCGHVSGSQAGRFKDHEGNFNVMHYDRMTEALEAKIEFKFDEEIEISHFKEFTIFKKVNFNHQDPNGKFWGLSKNGYMIAGFFARKVEPTVTVYFLNKLKGSVGHDIPKSLADKIQAGDI